MGPLEVFFGILLIFISLLLNNYSIDFNITTTAYPSMVSFSKKIAIFVFLYRLLRAYISKKRKLALKTATLPAEDNKDYLTNAKRFETFFASVDSFKTSSLDNLGYEKSAECKSHRSYIYL